MPRKELQRYSSNLFDLWEKSVESTLILPDYSISLEIEEGSISGKGKIAAAVTALYFGIGSYSDFISGIETIGGQVSYVSNYLFKQAKSPFGCSNVNTRVRKNGGALSRLHTLFDKVQRGVLTADEAIFEAKKIFGAEGDALPEFISELQTQLQNAPLYPKQLNLIEEVDPCEELPLFPHKKPYNPRPKPIPQQYRIEIWRDSKKDKKHIKVIK